MALVEKLYKSLLVPFSKDKKLYSSLKNILGFYPQNIQLYKQALRHRSANQNDSIIQGDNERLEYLGDAVLGAIVAHYLFKSFPYKDEGFLTKMRSKIVSREELNRLAFKMGINTLIQTNVESLGRGNSINGDAFEALIGAVYLDKGYVFTYTFMVNHILNHHLDVSELETKETDYKSKLIELVQKEKKELKFNVAQDNKQSASKTYVVEVLIDGVVKATAEHFSKKRAEQIAAEVVCKEWIDQITRVKTVE